MWVGIFPLKFVFLCFVFVTPWLCLLLWSCLFRIFGSSLLRVHLSRLLSSQGWPLGVHRFNLVIICCLLCFVLSVDFFPLDDFANGLTRLQHCWIFPTCFSISFILVTLFKRELIASLWSPAHLSLQCGRCFFLQVGLNFLRAFQLSQCLCFGIRRL